MPIITIPEAIEVFRRGEFLIIVDDEDRENEGDLAIPAAAATPEKIAFMAREASGLICVSMSGEDLDRLNLPMMVPRTVNGTRFGTAFTVSVEAREGVTTGISAFDRAQTIAVLTDPEAEPGDLVQPGHVFPLRYQPGGVLAREGQTEASVDMALLAGYSPAAVICEIMEDDGTMARMPSLERFSQEHGIPIVTIADLIAYRQEHELPAHAVKTDSAAVDRVHEVHLPTRYGDFQLFAYREHGSHLGAEPHLVLVAGNPSGDDPVLVRMHSECLTGDVFGSGRCDCGEQLERALERISERGAGALIYLRQEGRGIGLLNKLAAYGLQDQGLDTVEANHQLGFPADARDYGVAAEILRDLGISRVELLTNNMAKVQGLEQHGIKVTGRVPLMITPGPDNRRYLETKQRKLGHLLDIASG